MESFSKTESNPRPSILFLHTFPKWMPKPSHRCRHLSRTTKPYAGSFLDGVSSKALSLPLPSPALGTSVPFFCCIFISFPVYKIAVIGAANQGCLDAKHVATCRWALCDPGTAVLIYIYSFFLHGKDDFSAKLNHDFLQQRRELLLQRKNEQPSADGNQDTSSQYITAYWNIPCIYFTICLSSLILGCAALLNYMFKANQRGEGGEGETANAPGGLCLLQ